MSINERSVRRETVITVKSLSVLKQKDARDVEIIKNTCYTVGLWICVMALIPSQYHKNLLFCSKGSSYFIVFNYLFIYLVIYLYLYKVKV